MDTPDRTNIAASSLSKFEDSPVFNFINNLSPIQPVKSVDSVQLAHSYQTLNFASLSPIFSSPHAIPQKELRNVTRHSFSDFSKECSSSSNNAGENNLSGGVSDDVMVSRCTFISQPSGVAISSPNEATVDPPDECHLPPGNLTGLTQYDVESPNHNTTPCYTFNMNVQSDIVQTQVQPVEIIQNAADRQKSAYMTEAGVCQNYSQDQNKDEILDCDWENLISVSDDGESLLIFNSPNKPEVCGISDEKALDNGLKLQGPLFSKIKDNADNQQITQPDYSDAPVQNATQDPHMNCDDDIEEEDGTDQFSTIISGKKVEKKQHRGVRRRCLIFDIAGVSKSHMPNDLNHTPSSKGKNICVNKSLKSRVSPSPCVLPGIGLHLNALATTSKDRIVTKETLASGKHLINMPSLIAPLPLSRTEGKSTSNSLAMESDMLTNGREGDDLQALHEETSQDAVPGICDELSQGSPKKKKRRSGNGIESDGCKRCNCKKSKCLKLYCECFAAGVYCSEPCSCQGCFNKPIHEETVLSTRKQIESRNPLAFAPKVIRTSDGSHETGEDDNKTPASARHKRGCNCKKSNCLKKYCECYQGGVGCSLSCRCDGCKNVYGTKEGILLIGETEQEDEETNASEKDKEKLGDKNANGHIDEHPFSDSVLPITPSFDSCRISIDLPLFSSAKLPRPSKLLIGCSPGLYGSCMLKKSENMLSQHKHEKNDSMIPEDDTPPILRATSSPTNGLKTASPNSKRVSPPHNAVGLTPNRKGGRKLILKSIPSFPSLVNEASAQLPVNHSKSPAGSSALR